MMADLTFISLVLALCARGSHETERQFGIKGITAAVLLFPIGLPLLA